MKEKWAGILLASFAMLPALAAGQTVPVPPRTDPMECLEAWTHHESTVSTLAERAAGSIGCVLQCFNKISGATIGFFDALTADPLGDVLVVRDTENWAFGVFAGLEPETNAQGQVIYHKYKIRDGFSLRADRCYDDDEPAPLMHEEEV